MRWFNGSLHELETQGGSTIFVSVLSFLLHCLSQFSSFYPIINFLFSFLFLLSTSPTQFFHLSFLGPLSRPDIVVVDPVRNIEEGPPSKSSSMELQPESPTGRSDSPGASPRFSKQHIIDTAAPFESVKDAVSKFGGRVDWKSRRTQSLVEERSKLVEDFRREETVEELENTKKLTQKLRRNLEKVERDELLAKEEAERVHLKIEEMEQSIVSEANIEAKAEVEAEKAMLKEALSELEFVKKELDSLREEHASMVSGRDTAVNNAEETVAASQQIEKAVEDLTAELIATKEALNSSRAAHLEAEEQTLGVDDEEILNLKQELEQAEEELQTLNEKAFSVRLLKSKLESASSLLLDLKAEMATFMESKDNEECYKQQKEELEELKKTKEKAASDVKSLREACMSLNSKLEEEKSILATLKQSEEMASAAVLNLQTELEKSKTAAIFLEMNEHEARKMMSELPKKLQKAAEEADEAKSLAQSAQEELLEAQQEVEEVKSRSITLENSLVAALKEIEAAKIAEMLARDAITALEKSESAKNNNDNSSSSMVTLTLDEYHVLSSEAFKAEEEANARIEAANAQIKLARESEYTSLARLEELNEELSLRKESLNIATENAEKAAEEKLAMEHELSALLVAEQEEEPQEKANELNEHTAAEIEPVHEPLSPKEEVPSKSTENGSSSYKNKKKKKKSLFPSKVVMFFAKKKTHPSK
ncbi:protein WEAK CHLOROPLAST MOVEMENT UNDER BLUE LIGHT 1-like [Vigna unguiculata]|uniref:protein WEAK CHLOROPLAST MOVEMENT UNDER BLUE LIGHT 1-like n=1 Tax=Vigna unguiculata TaxID=3917 RepID=UPI001017193A|nr:protein WEAK CHLOROPLAST MOVEMENT UNDER BLUE LIGHT 1-like [Vigna unguiculata]